MCGRFVQFSPASLLSEIYKLESTTESVNFNQANYNITPGNDITAVLKCDGKNVLDKLRWGFLPKWAVGSATVKPVINAVSETIYKKKFFVNAVKRSRCIVPMDGFYEWTAQPNGSAKIPYYFKRRQSLPFAVAAIYEQIEIKDTLGKVTSVNVCAILTCEANDIVKPIHSRMPMIIKDMNIDEWLSIADLDEISFNLFSAPIQPEFLEAYRVSTLVNSPKNNGENLIQPE